MMNLEELKYPIGRFTRPTEITPEIIEDSIATISDFPMEIESASNSLTNEQLDTPYRPDGWTIRQVIHHCADSHINSFTRFKLALTENQPTIKPYLEAKWAEQPDYQLPIQSSIDILKGLHYRWTVLLNNLTTQDLEKTFLHPENQQQISLAENICIYAWHCQHHLGHILQLKQRQNWV